jgi:integrase/recombinase XerD
MGTVQVQRIILKDQEAYLLTLVEAFLIDRKAAGLSKRTVEFYDEKLQSFVSFCERRAIERVTQVTADELRRWLLELQERHTPGGCFAHYRAVRAFLLWVEREGELEGWASPTRRVKAPRVKLEPISGVEMGDVEKMLAVCGDGFTGRRDRALLMFLLDTGVRASECLRVNLEDIDWVSGGVLVRKAKSGKPRVVFMSKTTSKALRRWVRLRATLAASSHVSLAASGDAALWVTEAGERLTYGGLVAMLRRRARQAGVAVVSPHDFRRAFALECLRGGMDVYSLQRLMGHSDLSVLRRYLAQTEGDLQEAHRRASPVERLKGR